MSITEKGNFSQMKRPSFQFYPGDWLNDAALRMVSIGARGLWMDMICIMHQGSNYGYLKVNHKVILTSNLARICGSTLPEVEGWLSELCDAGVYSIDESGCIFSRRMIRDEEIRKARAEGGSKGGNPALTGKNKVNLPPNLPPTPSSSSSSSSSKGLITSNDVICDLPGQPTQTVIKDLPIPTKPDCPHKEILALYHEILPSCPSIRDWTPSRATALRTRWNEKTKHQNLEYWRGLFEYIASIPFLIGQKSGRDGRVFFASLDWIVKAENFAKIREGRYQEQAA